MFLRKVDLRSVAAEIAHARLPWLALSLATMFVNLAIRSLRWQYLLEPLGRVSFANAFRATAVGFAASSILPARAGEVIRPYFLARHENMTATGAFATIILERVLDVLTVLALLASFIFIFDSGVGQANPTAWVAVKWAGVTAGGGALAALVVMFVLAGDPERLGRAMIRLEQVVPSALAGLIARVAEKFAPWARRRPEARPPARRAPVVVPALAVDRGRHLGGGGGVSSRGAVHRIVSAAGAARDRRRRADAGRHRRISRGVSPRHDDVFGAPEDAAVGAAIVLHVFSIGPSLLLGLFFAAQTGLNLSSMRRLANQAESGRTA